MNQRKIRVILWVLALGVVAYWGVRWLRPLDPVAVLADAKEALARGNTAYDAKRYAVAEEHFERAVRISMQGLEAVAAAEKRRPSAEKQQQNRKISSELCWTFSMGARDAAYAKSAVEGKPIADSHDTSLNQPYRSYLPIPEKDRKEAVSMLRRAVRYGNEDPALLLDALRTEVMLQPVSWRFVETLAKGILQADANDQRAQYLLARIDFEQPNDAGEPTPKDRRRRKEVEESADRIERLKQTQTYPVWRVWHLEAKVRQWLLEDAIARKDSASARSESAKLDDLLWNRTAALAKAQAGEGMTTWSNWDSEGMVALFQIAFDLKAREAKKAPADGSALVKPIDDYLGLCRQRQADRPAKLQTAVLAPRLIDMLVRAQPMVSKGNRIEWGQLLARCDEWLGQASLGERRPLEALHPFALLFLLESRTERGRGDAKACEQSAKRAEHWLQEGLRLAQSAKTPGREAPFLFSLALMKIDSGATRANVAEWMGVLRSQSESAGYASLLEASLALREGQLERTLDLLNQIDKSQAARHRFRIPLLQVQAYRGLNSFNKALDVYRSIERSFADWDELTVDERISLLEAYPRREKLDALMALTQLDIAADKYATAYRDSPKKAAGLDLSVHENAVESALSRMSNGSDLRLQVLQHYVISLKSIHPAKADSTMKLIADEAPKRLVYWSTALAMSQPLDDRDGIIHAKQSARVIGDAKKAGIERDELMLLEAIHWFWTSGDGESALRFVKQVDVSKLPKDAAASMPLPFIDFVAQFVEPLEKLPAWRPALELANERYPHDPSVAYYLGKSLISEDRVQAEFHLRRAENLARCRPLGVSAEYRERWRKAAQAALESLR
ncbi:MAG: hypothetical protein K2X38_16230 [Gemmataceae bacterium]|nr:hypothetical protein [Gemmataceae bacterium]